jgi:Tfp pilus assembly protein PilN
MSALFRINLNTERRERVAARRRRARLAAAVATMLGLQALLLGVVLLSVGLLQERRDALAADIPRLQALAASADDGDVVARRALAKVRRERVDWAPQLAALGELIDRDVLLTGISGEGPAKKSGAILEISGIAAGGGADLSGVSRFVEALRDDERFIGRYGVVTLGTIRSGSGAFRIVCGEPKRK